MNSSLWPKGEPFALCLTHDVDRIMKYPYHYLYYGIANGFSGSIVQAKTIVGKIKGIEPYWNFEKLIEMEDSCGVRSTFFFLNESSRGFGPQYWGRYDISDSKTKRIIRKLDDGGWEIGLHGSYYSYKNKKLMAEEKKILEDIVGKTVRSTRQHYLNMAPGLTWQIQHEIGLEFDSTAGSATDINDDVQNMFPYFPDNTSILEMPVTIMDTIGLERAFVHRKIENHIQKIIELGGLVVLDWHQCAFNFTEHPERVKVYFDIIDKAKELGAWITSMGKIGDYWKNKITDNGYSNA